MIIRKLRLSALPLLLMTAFLMPPSFRAGVQAGRDERQHIPTDSGHADGRAYRKDKF